MIKPDRQSPWHVCPLRSPRGISYPGPVPEIGDTSDSGLILRILASSSTTIIIKGGGIADSKSSFCMDIVE